MQKAYCIPHIYKYPVPQEKDDSRVNWRMDTQPIIEWQQIKILTISRRIIIIIIMMMMMMMMMMITIVIIMIIHVG